MKVKKKLIQLIWLLLALSVVVSSVIYWRDWQTRKQYDAYQDRLLLTSASSIESVQTTDSDTQGPSTTAARQTTTESNGSSTTFTIKEKREPVKPDPLTAEIAQLLKELESQNADVVGWIRIPDTQIDYPVVLGQDNAYYLNHNVSRSYSRYGSIFMDYRNNAQLDQKHTIVYGHHMRDQTMFAELMRYKDQSFFKRQPIIEYYTPNEKTEWVIFSVYVTSVDFYYIRTPFRSEDEYRDFLDDIRQRSMFFRDIDVTRQDAILTLSTCTYEFDDARFVVHAVRRDRETLDIAYE